MTSITVKGTDNFSATYVVPAGLAVTAFPVGTTVRVIAKVSGSTVTLVTIHAARTPGTAGVDGKRRSGGPAGPGGTDQQGGLPGGTPRQGGTGSPSTTTVKPTI